MSCLRAKKLSPWVYILRNSLENVLLPSLCPDICESRLRFLSFPGIEESDSFYCYINLVSSSFSWLAECNILNRSSMCLIQYAGAGFAHRAVKCCGWLNCDITGFNHRFERQDRNDSTTVPIKIHFLLY